MKQILLYLVILIVSISCSNTRHVYIDVLDREPSIVFPTETKKITVVDNSIISNNTDTVFTLNKRSFTSKDVMDSTRYFLTNAIVEYMKAEKVWNSVETYPFHPKPLHLYKDVTDGELPLTADEVVDICSKTGADALLSLDYLLVVLIYNPIADSGGTLDISIKAIVRGYKHDGTVLGKVERKETSLFNSIHQHDNTNISTDVLYWDLNHNSQNVADIIVDSFFSRWTPQLRVYFEEPSLPSYKTIANMDSSRCIQAAQRWEEAYNKEINEEKRIKYASNLAFIYESMDNMEMALKWINVAESELSSDYSYKTKSLAKEIKFYQKKLKERVDRKRKADLVVN